MRLRSPRTSFALSLAVVFFLPARALAGVPSPFGRAPHAQAQSPARSRSGEWKSFRGTVGKYRVQMRLQRAGDALDGSYFYERSKAGGLRLEGAVDGEGHFTLREFDAAGAQTGLFKGTWDEAEKEQELYLTGQWSRPDGTRQTEFSLAEMFIAFRGPARIVTRELKDADRRMNFEINVEYPQLEGLSAAGAAGFNEAARALASKEAADFRKGVADYRADYRGEKPPGPGNSLDLGYYVDYADDNLVSIGFTEDTYYAGASARLENYRNWLVKRQGLEITFDPYQVGPYVAGPQYVAIPYKALAKIINPAGPLAPFLK